MARKGSVTYDDVAIQDGISFRHGDAATGAAYGNPVLDCHVRHFYRCSNHYGRAVRAVLGDEKNAHGKDKKVRKSAYAHALTTSL